MLTVFGVTALSFMMLMYTLEGRHRYFIAAFAVGCGLSSTYGFLSGSWPFGVIEGVWCLIAARRFVGPQDRRTTTGTGRIDRIEHVQLAMPAGGEDAARSFYTGLLGIPERTKPDRLSGRGGCWFEDGGLKIHIGVDPDFRPARKAHAALVVDDLAALVAGLEEAAVPIRGEEPVEGFHHVYVDDPFGNRIELMEAQGGI